LGIVLADLINLLNLPMYVIGGGVADAWEDFAPSMMEVVRRNSYVYQATALRARRSTAIARALLGSDAGLIGAARLSMAASETAASETKLPL
jgi:glucokinase